VRFFADTPEPKKNHTNEPASPLSDESVRCILYEIYSYGCIVYGERIIRTPPSPPPRTPLRESSAAAAAVSPRHTNGPPPCTTAAARSGDFRSIIEFGTIRRENNWLRNESSVMFAATRVSDCLYYYIHRTRIYTRIVCI